MPVLQAEDRVIPQGLFVADKILTGNSCSIALSQMLVSRRMIQDGNARYAHDLLH
jgi:hypothetical protein